MINFTIETFKTMTKLLSVIKLFVSLKNENKDFFVLNSDWINWSKELNITQEEILKMIDSEIYCQTRV